MYERFARLGVGIIILVSTALADEEHRHPPQDKALHDKFYSTWYQPADPTKSCCSQEDCYPTEFKYVNRTWYARRREDGVWVYVPPNVFEHNRRDGKQRESPDDQSHVCMQKPLLADKVYCAVVPPRS
jgi:hypothetical protein